MYKIQSILQSLNQESEGHQVQTIVHGYIGQPELDILGSDERIPTVIN